MGNSDVFRKAPELVKVIFSDIIVDLNCFNFFQIHRRRKTFMKRR